MVIQVLYEWNEAWPEKGVLHVEGRFMGKAFGGEISISPALAKRRANGYLSMDVAMAIVADDPVLVWDERPVWRLQAHLLLPDWGRIAQVGTVDVDAMTGDVIPLSPPQISEMQQRANDLATRLAPDPAPAI